MDDWILYMSLAGFSMVMGLLFGIGNDGLLGFAHTVAGVAKWAFGWVGGFYLFMAVFRTWMAIAWPGPYQRVWEAWFAAVQMLAAAYVARAAFRAADRALVARWRAQAAKMPPGWVPPSPDLPSGPPRYRGNSFWRDYGYNGIMFVHKDDL